MNNKKTGKGLPTPSPVLNLLLTYYTTIKGFIFYHNGFCLIAVLVFNSPCGMG